MLISILITSLLPLCAQNSGIPEGAFENLDKVQRRYISEDKVNAATVNEKSQSEYIWMSSVAPRVKDHEGFTSAEIERLWENYRNGEKQERLLAFSMIVSIQESSNWLPELKRLMKSESEIDQKLVFSVLEAYTRNDYGRFQEKDLFEDSEVLDFIKNYTDHHKDKDEHFQNRIKKVQDYALIIKEKRGIKKRLPHHQEVRAEKSHPGTQTHNNRNMRVKPEDNVANGSSFLWWSIGGVTLIFIVGFILLRGKRS